jgi:protein gp37
MLNNGFDPTCPIILGKGDWTDVSVVIDGHTRLQVANNLKIEPEFTTKWFESELAAIEYAIHRQLDRRNLNDAELLLTVPKIHQMKPRGGNNNPEGKNQYEDEDRSKAQDCAIDQTVVGYSGDHTKPSKSTKSSEKSVEHTAAIFKISPRKIEQVLAVAAEDTPEEIKEAVLKGKKTMNQAYQEVRKIKKEKLLTEEPKSRTGKPYYPTFNLTNENIEWAKWSWNPVTGCYNNCPFCYAKWQAHRFYEEKFEYTVHRDRFSAPHNTKIPKGRADEPGIHNVFVCSMADLFGDWVKENVIQEILDICSSTPQWTYIFLTKNPKRLLDFEFPKNSWVGTTVHEKSYVEAALSIMPKVNAPVKFLSCEPLLEDLEIEDLTGVNWVIIGGCTKTPGHPAFQPDWEWVEKLLFTARKSDCKVYFKPNLTVVPKEYPEV